MVAWVEGWLIRIDNFDHGHAPFFPVSTPQAFYELLEASASKDPDAMKTFAGAHPEIANLSLIHI